MGHWRDAVRDSLLALSFLPRSVFFLILAVLSLGMLALAAQPSAVVVPAPSTPSQAPALLRDIERLMILGTVAAVFAVFLLLQVSYLFGNPGGRTGSGLTYADAVHRGFGELTVAATLCMLLALVLDRHAARGTRESLVKAVTLLLVAESALLLLSAHLRLLAYEDAYGYTLQRLYVHAYTMMAAVALVLLAWEVCVAIDASRLFRRLGLAAALAVAVLAYWNHAAWIARENIARYQSTGMIDIDYLAGGLGADAVPEVIRSLPVLDATLAQQARNRLEVFRRAPPDDPRWYQWNLRRKAARRALATLPEATPAAN